MKKSKNHSNIKAEGERAYLLGRELSACPYTEGTVEYDQWIEGWCEKDEEFFEAEF